MKNLPFSLLMAGGVLMIFIIVLFLVLIMIKWACEGAYGNLAAQVNVDGVEYFSTRI
jgi:hypothetical protein